MNQHTYTHFNENSKIPNIKVIRDYLESVKCDNFDEVFLYIENKDYNALKELLAKENPDDENSLFYARDGEGRTSLMFAALLGDLKAVQILLEPFEGIEVYNYIGITSEPFKWNAIFYAIFGGNAEVVAILLERSQLEDYLPYRDIFNWSSFDYLMLNEKLFLELFEMSNECNILLNWIKSSLNDTNGEIPQNGDRLPIRMKDLCKAGIVSMESSMPLFRVLIFKKMSTSIKKGEIRSMFGKNYYKGYTKEEEDYLYGRKSIPDTRLILNGEKYNVFYFYYFPIVIASLEGNKEILKRLTPIMGTVHLDSVNRKDKKLVDYICANTETFEEKITLLRDLFGEEVKGIYKNLLKNSKLTLEEKMKILNLKTKEEYLTHMLPISLNNISTEIIEDLIDMFDL